MAIPQPLSRLINLLKREIEALTSDVAGDQITPIYWQREMEAALTRYHQAAYMAGSGAPTMNDTARKFVSATVKAQLDFLNGFVIDIQGEREWQKGWNARAAMYADAIKTPYWKGATNVLPLPAMPADGTQCLSNCKCSWEIAVVDEAAGDYDAYWRRGADDSCQTCLEREARWSPVQIRGGVLQL